MLHDDLQSVLKTLQDGITKGYWTLEHLDQESPGLQLLKNEVRQHRVCGKSQHRHDASPLHTQPPVFVHWHVFPLMAACQQC